jgi:RimJ/RimL family protein N-acetyltransferase
MTVPELTTPRLGLRPIAADDVEAFAPIVTDPEAMRFVGGPRTGLDGVRAWLTERLARCTEQGLGGWAVLRGEQVAGVCCLWPSRALPGGLPEIGWILGREHWGKGYAAEAADTVVRYGFRQLGLPAIWALVSPGNAASLTLATRLGFVEVGDHPYDRGHVSRVLVATRRPAGEPHHIELWVPDLDRARDSLGWLFAELGWVRVNSWSNGESWRYGSGYVVLEAGPDRTDDRHERCRPGLNHLALHAGSRERVDELAKSAVARGWQLLFTDRHPHAGGDRQHAAYLENADGFEIELVAEPALG